MNRSLETVHGELEDVDDDSAELSLESVQTLENGIEDG